MLKLIIHGEQSWNEELEEFIYSDTVVLELEHSLISLSKWEEKWEKPFMGAEDKTTEETLGYIQAMCVTPDVPPEVFQTLNNDHFRQVNEYINAKSSATWFSEAPGGDKKPRKRETITSEVLYHWIFAAEMDAKVVEKWHLNRLFIILKIHNEKNSKPKKMNKVDAAAQRRALNAKRKAELGTSG